MRIENGAEGPAYIKTLGDPIQKNTSTSSKKETANLKLLDTQVKQLEQTHEKTKTIDEYESIRAIEKANKKLKLVDRRLEFSIHDKTKEIMVKVIDNSNDAVIREIPSEKVLDMVAHLWEIAGILVDEKR